MEFIFSGDVSNWKDGASLVATKSNLNEVTFSGAATEINAKLGTTAGNLTVNIDNAAAVSVNGVISNAAADFPRWDGAGTGTLNLNVKGVFNATRAASECMVARGAGVILTTSSMVSISGQPSGFAYPASKFAVNGLTVSLARELGPKGIRVNAVAPGITETDMMKAVPKEVIDPMVQRIPLRRLGQPEDIANAFAFLASDEASYITGVVLSVDGMARS
jgi:NAD(P)-dependent dehydrogenase (short-subunit alcohol dehydrogenase family)